MESESRVNFSLLFNRFFSILFGCAMIPMIMIDEIAYKGRTDLLLNSTSLVLMKPTIGTSTITDLNLPKVNMTSLHIAQHNLPSLHMAQQFHIWPTVEVAQYMQFFNWLEWFSASLSHAVCVVVVTTMIFMMWQQRKQVYILQKELSSLKDASHTKMSVLQQIQYTLDSQQSQFTSTTYKMAAMNKRIDKISTELDDENSDLETMYKCLNEWKYDWISQSDKIRQINVDHVSKLKSLHHSDVENMVQDQQEQIRKYISHAEVQFEKIFRYLKQDNGAINNVLDDLDYINDVLCQQYR